MKPDLHRFPLLVAWEMTRACLLAYLHCRASAEPNPLPGELSTEEGLRLLRELSTYTPKPILLPTGGDPLARPDLFLLLEEAQRLGLKVGITPAVTPRLTREVVARFKALGVHQMAISLDGASPEAHDGFRGVEGTFALALKALDWAREVGLMTQVNTTVSRRTWQELPGIPEILAEKGVATWEVFFLVPVGRGALLDQLSPEEYEEGHAPPLRPLPPPPLQGAHHRGPHVLPGGPGEAEGGRGGQGLGGGGTGSPPLRRLRLCFRLLHGGGLPFRLPSPVGRKRAGTPPFGDLTGKPPFPGASQQGAPQGEVRPLRVPGDMRGKPGPGLGGNRGLPGLGSPVRLHPQRTNAPGLWLGEEAIITL